MHEYLVVIHKAGANYSAYSPDVAGCGALGDTIEETVANMQQSLEMHLESIVEDGDELPEPRGLRYYLDANETIAEATAFITHLAIAVPELA